MGRWQTQSLPRTAAEWFAARRGPRDAELERQFVRWIGESPANAEEYALCELTWDLSAAAAAGLEPESRAPWWRRPRMMAGAAAAAACAAVAVLLVLWLGTPAVSQWQTGPGEQLTVGLEDGSRVTMNTRSSLEVRIGRAAREVRMLGGEAFFEVAQDPSRPFVVDTPLGSARVVGTRFNVLLEEERVEVTTEEGKVLVQGAAEGAAGVMAIAGTRATLVRGEARAALGRADLNRIENWRAQRLEFDSVPLEAALKEFSRYTAVPIRAATPEIGQMHVSAVLRVGDVEALRATLQGAFGLTVITGPAEWLVAGGDEQ